MNMGIASMFQWCVSVSVACAMGVSAAGLRARQSAPGSALVSVPAIRLSGTVEAVRARAVMVPRLAGQTTSTLVITHLVGEPAKPAGSARALFLIWVGSPEEDIGSIPTRHLVQGVAGGRRGACA